MSDLGAPDGQEPAEALDADKVDDDRGFADEPLGDYPPDRPLGADAYGVTAQQDKIDEPFDERVAHEEPDDAVEALDEELARQDDLAPDDLDGSQEAELTAELDRLEAAELDPDGDAVRDVLGIGADGESAEEAALHVEAEP